MSGKIAFDSSQGSPSRGNTFTVNIFTIDADGNNRKQLTDASCANLCPRFSSDGRKIVFFLYRGNDNEIHTINWDGSEQKCILRGDCSEPCFSPDGKIIAFKMGWTIHLMNSDGTNIRQLTQQSEVSRLHNNPVFTADGKNIIYDDESLFIVEIATGEVRSFLSPVVGSHRSYENVAVSPDGKKIAFENAWCREANGNDYEWVYTIFTANIDGSELTEVSPGFRSARSPAFSFHGSCIAFSGAKDDEPKERIYVAQLDGSRIEPITDGIGGASLSWAPSVE